MLIAGRPFSSTGLIRLLGSLIQGAKTIEDSFQLMDQNHFRRSSRHDLAGVHQAAQPLALVASLAAAFDEHRPHQERELRDPKKSKVGPLSTLKVKKLFEFDFATSTCRIPVPWFTSSRLSV